MAYHLIMKFVWIIGFIGIMLSLTSTDAWAQSSCCSNSQCPSFNGDGVVNGVYCTCTAGWSPRCFNAPANCNAMDPSNAGFCSGVCLGVLQCGSVVPTSGGNCPPECKRGPSCGSGFSAATGCGNCGLDQFGDPKICCRPQSCGGEPDPPVNGVCASTHYNCSVGGAFGQGESTSQYYWSCSGANGGTAASCVEYKPPVCTGAVPQSLVTSATSGTFYVYANGVVNATSVFFPTWSAVGGQDDIVWYPGANMGGGNWRAAINLASHPGLGTIYVHVYMNNVAASNVWCSSADFRRNAVPVFSGLTMRNSSGTSVGWDSGNRNQICKTAFKNDPLPRTAVLVASLSDADGGADIVSANLRWNGTVYPTTLSNVSGNNVTATATVNFAANYPSALPLALEISDTAMTVPYADTGFLWKVWNCNVPVVGSVYDSSTEAFGAVCSTGSGFNTLASAAVNFRWVSVGSTIVNAATVNTYSGMNLSWGGNYALVPNSDLLVSGLVTRWIDMGMVGVGVTSCGTAQSLNNTTVDPYNVNPRLQVDFSGVTNQEPWFQTSGGGIQAAGSVENMVPITCANEPSLCTASMSVESAAGAADNGLVSGSALTNNSGCSITGSGAMCDFGAPNNWYRNGSSLSSADRYNYRFFYDRYYSALGLGITLGPSATMSDVIGRGGTGVFLVNGDFNVDVDNVVPANRFLMIVSRGTITFLNTVNNSAGMFVADSGIGTSPGVNTGLVIDGLLYSSGGNVRLNRGFADKIDNNTNPAVLVRYRPDLLFSMPGNLFRLLSNWRQF